jgi:hypothetical protein
LKLWPWHWKIEGTLFYLMTHWPVVSLKQLN